MPSTVDPAPSSPAPGRALSPVSSPAPSPPIAADKPTSVPAVAAATESAEPGPASPVAHSPQRSPPQTTGRPLPAVVASPKGILKRRRATAPEQATTDDPSVYMEGKRLRFRSMGDLGSDRTSQSTSPAPLSPFSAGPSKRRTDTTAAEREAADENNEAMDGLGTLPSDSNRSRKLVDINHGEELRDAVQRLDRFCEASVEWSTSLESQGHLAASPGGSRLSRKHSLATSPGASPRAQPAQPRPFMGGPGTTPLARPSLSHSPKSAAAQLSRLPLSLPSSPPSLPPRSHPLPDEPPFPFTEARRQSLPETLQNAAASLVVMQGHPGRSKSLPFGRASISASSNVLPPLSAPSSPPPRRKSSASLYVRRTTLAPKLPSFHDVLNNDRSVGGASQLLHKYRRLSQPNVHAHAAAVASVAAAAAAASSGPTGSNASEPASDGVSATPPPPMTARSLVQTYTTVLRERLQSWEGLENLVKDAEAVADNWEETGMDRVETTYGGRQDASPREQHQAFHPHQHQQQQSST